jgi:hypothetical protein
MQPLLYPFNKWYECSFVRFDNGHWQSQIGNQQLLALTAHNLCYHDGGFIIDVERNENAFFKVNASPKILPNILKMSSIVIREPASSLIMSVVSCAYCIDVTAFVILVVIGC